MPLTFLVISLEHTHFDRLFGMQYIGGKSDTTLQSFFYKKRTYQKK